MSATQRRSWTTRLAIATLALALVAACSSDDDSSGDTTAEDMAATEAASSEEPPDTALATTTAMSTTTSITTTTSTTSTTTTEPPPQPTERVVGLVWASAVSDERINTDTPQPTYEADGISSRIENVLLVDSGSADDIQSDCAEEARFRQDFEGGELATQCLIVQWAFDVAEDFSTDEFSQDGDLVPGAIVTPEGRQLD
jgi:hypothetical protein